MGRNSILTSFLTDQASEFILSVTGSHQQRRKFTNTYADLNSENRHGDGQNLLTFRVFFCKAPMSVFYSNVFQIISLFFFAFKSQFLCHSYCFRCVGKIFAEYVTSLFTFKSTGFVAGITGCTPGTGIILA